jgi:hypothetical protein
MTHRLDTLNEREKWAKRKIVDVGFRLLFKRHYRVEAILWRPLAVADPLPITSVDVKDKENSLREVYGDYSGLAQETDEMDMPIVQDGSQPPYVIFGIDVLVPPLSFVPFSDQYHSTQESTFSYCQDGRLKNGDFLAIQHPESDDNYGNRSKRIFKVDHMTSVGVTIAMYKQFILTPYPENPPGMAAALLAFQPGPTD